MGKDMCSTPLTCTVHLQHVTCPWGHQWAGANLFLCTRPSSNAAAEWIMLRFSTRQKQILMDTLRKLSGQHRGTKITSVYCKAFFWWHLYTQTVARLLTLYWAQDGRLFTSCRAENFKMEDKKWACVLNMQYQWNACMDLNAINCKMCRNEFTSACSSILVFTYIQVNVSLTHTKLRVCFFTRESSSLFT